MVQSQIDNFTESAIETVRAAVRVQIVGGQSKQKLQSSLPGEAVIVTTENCGVVEYDRHEFTMTVRSGTTIHELATVLSANNQFLPFDPMFAEQGATIGGTLASGLNGPCRLLYGGIRDFVLGTTFIDGHGNRVTAGGRVVKNAAGFDLPKFLVGSMGKFGLIVELTLKVFPRPSHTLTMCLDASNLASQQVVDLMVKVNSLPLEMMAFDWNPNKDILVRLGGIDRAIEVQAEDLLNRSAADFRLESPDEDIWKQAGNATWAESAAWIAKIPIVPSQIATLEPMLEDSFHQRRYCAAGNVCLVALRDADQIEALHRVLVGLSLVAQLVVGDGRRNLIGNRQPGQFLERVKHALDPNQKFGSIFP